MKFLVVILAAAFSISCTQKIAEKDRQVSSVADSCFERGIKNKPMRDKLVKGECNDLQRFCDISSIGWNEVYQSESYVGVERSFYNEELYSSGYGAWGNSMYPIEANKLACVKYMFGSLENIMTPTFTIDEYNLEPLSEEKKKILTKKINDTFNGYSEQPEVQQMNKTSNRTFVCAFLLKFDIFHFNDCQKAILTITEHVKQRNGLTLPKEYIETHTDEKYIKPLHRVAKKIISYLLESGEST